MIHIKVSELKAFINAMLLILETPLPNPPESLDNASFKELIAKVDEICNLSIIDYKKTLSDIEHFGPDELVDLPLNYLGPYAHWSEG